MTQFLPPNLLALFAPRDPIPYLPPHDKLPHEKKQTHNYQGIAQYVHLFEDPVDTPAPVEVERREERRERRKKEKAEQVAYKLEQEIAVWNPERDVGDPFKTLFVARINYYTSESKLRREFEQYGNIKSISVAQNSKDKKPRGYAFIEYESEKDMHSAYKKADGKKIDGRRVLVDVERGRTVKGWLPRRLGGGLGGTRKGGNDVNVRHSGRDDSRRERSRSRDRVRDRDRDRRRDRSRSRDRKRRSRSRDRRRDRSRDRKRSRSRDRKRSKRSRSKSRDRERRREKRERSERGGDEFKVKDEPADTGYEGQYDQGVYVKQEKMEEEEGANGGGGEEQGGYDNGEANY